MSEYLGTRLQPVQVPGSDNPLQSYLDQISHLHGFTAGLRQPTPAPVGTSTVQSMSMPSPAFTPLAYVGAGGQGVTVPEAEASAAEHKDTALTLGLGMVGDAPGTASRTGNILRAYHGTPHTFPATPRNPLGEFDLTKMGTGEGAQVYGRGAYLAQAKGIGEHYRDALATPTPSFDATAMPGSGSNRMAPAEVKDVLREHLAAHPNLKDVSDTTLLRSADFIVDKLGDGYTPDEVRAMAPKDRSFPFMRLNELGQKDVLDAALGFMRDVPANVSWPTIGGVRINPDDPMHRAVQAVRTYAGDMPAAIGDVERQLAAKRSDLAAVRIRDPEASAVHDAYQRQVDSLSGALEHLRGSQPLAEYKEPLGGRLYEAEIDAHPHELLHYDLPFSQQSPQVQEKLRGLGIGEVPKPPEMEWRVTDDGRHVLYANGRNTRLEMRPNPKVADTFDEYSNGRFTGSMSGPSLEHWKGLQADNMQRNLTARSPDMTGREVLDTVGGGAGKRASETAANALRDAGIPGLRYYDAMSRRGGDQTHNYVMFEPDTINIVKRDNQGR